MDVWRGTSHLEGEREMARKIEGVRRRGGILERWLKTDRSICHHWREEKRSVRWTEGWERERQSGGERRRDAKRDGEEFRGHNNDKMTRGWSKHGSCLPTGQGEWERWRRGRRRRGDSRLKGHSVYGEKERLRDIDVRREESDEERQLGMERGPLAVKRERDDGAKEGQRAMRTMGAWEGENSHGGRDEGRKRSVGESRRREAEIQWEYGVHCTEAVLWYSGNMRDPVCSKSTVFLIQMRESTGTERGDWEAWVIYLCVRRAGGWGGGSIDRGMVSMVALSRNKERDEGIICKNSVRAGPPLWIRRKPRSRFSRKSVNIRKIPNTFTELYQYMIVHI